ncbi:hypothetical protein [Roseomonas xinghualingensis]|uniref:hypothetical protein n=1 Tax=Roseomonas xinghualingensis TaxID=2986475 RepID=UPI0021F0DD8D|nr:hypothetical protein [Roseomonas sp. SXEYE001]MCV4209760.1 hypothetical protein [Roseomonas sp. SXEYE001]
MSAAETSSPASLTVWVPLTIRRRPGRKTIVTPNGVALQAQATATTQTRGDPALVKALARAFRYQRMLDEGRYASISEMAAGEKLDRGYMGRLLQLTLLAPEIVEKVLDGRQPDQLDLPRLMQALPSAWSEQTDTLATV